MRYQRQRPGELIHIDSKKLGRIDGIGHRITGDRTGQSSKRGTGWEALHVAVDDASRLAYTELLPNERKHHAIAFLERALAFFAAHGVAVERVMTDNGSAYKSYDFAAACRVHGLRHLRTGRTGPAPTERPSASSRARCANGSTPSLTAGQQSGPLIGRDGSTGTITTAHIQP